MKKSFSSSDLEARFRCCKTFCISHCSPEDWMVYMLSISFCTEMFSLVKLRVVRAIIESKPQLIYSPTLMSIIIIKSRNFSLFGFGESIIAPSRDFRSPPRTRMWIRKDGGKWVKHSHSYRQLHSGEIAKEIFHFVGSSFLFKIIFARESSLTQLLRPPNR